jgi:hypothetical protein
LILTETAHKTVRSLAGAWGFSLSCREKASYQSSAALPASLSEQGIGEETDRQELLYLTEARHHVGPASFRKFFSLPELHGRRVIFSMERARATRVWVNGQYAGRRDLLTSAQEYDISALIHAGENSLEVETDNSFAGLPKDPILGSHMATEHTQTNWNGILGRIELTLLPPVSLRRVRVYPCAKMHRARVDVQVDQFLCPETPLTLSVCGPDGALLKKLETVSPQGSQVLSVEVELAEQTPLWDEFQPSMTHLCVLLESSSGRQLKRAVFGLRDYTVAADHHHFAVNGRSIFVRSETNCAVFPQTGYAPMDVPSWEKLLRLYRGFGVNYVRFHSWCPPEAAFAVADRLGLYLQPELCEWTFHTFEEDSEFDYYTREAKAILDAYGNHPSLVALTWGNELRSARRDRMGELCRTMRAYDSTRLYAEGSNTWYGEQGINPDSDFVLAQSNHEAKWRGAYAGNHGFINDEPPAAQKNYSRELAGIDKPVISFEVGQFQVYPDYREIDGYRGVLEPRNLKAYRAGLEKNGMAGLDRQFHQTSGRLAMLCYREEIEAALRTPELAGISLLGLQDFPGQGTALVGMIDSLGNAKRFVHPAEFHQFFSSVVPLLKADRRVFRAGETAELEVLVSNFGQGPLTAPVLCIVSNAQTGEEFSRRYWLPEALPQGALTAVGSISFPMPQVETAAVLRFSLSAGEGGQNHYDLFVYPAWTPSAADRARVVTALDDTVRARLERGENLLIAPEISSAALPESIQSSYMSDFWCWVMFQKWDQHGTMGLCLDPAHPLFREFPTESFTDPRWWNLLHGSRAMCLTGSGVHPLVRMADNLQRNEELALCYEVKIGRGTALVCSLCFGDWADLESRPDAAWFLRALLRYLDSPACGGKAVPWEFLTQRICGARTDLLNPVPADPSVPAVKAAVCVNQESAELALRGQGGFWDTTGLPQGAPAFYELDFAAPVVMDTVQLGLLLDDVYDGKVGHDLPGSIELMWMAENGWQPVVLLFKSSLTQGDDNILYFEPVQTQKLKIIFGGPKTDGVVIQAISLFANQPVAVSKIHVFGPRK